MKALLFIVLLLASPGLADVYNTTVYETPVINGCIALTENGYYEVPCPTEFNISANYNLRPSGSTKLVIPSWNISVTLPTWAVGPTKRLVEVFG